MTMPLDVVKVNLAALEAIERHGERALEVAEEALSITSNPEFAIAVIAEIKLIRAAQDKMYH
jgi:hypothetical protein